MKAVVYSVRVNMLMVSAKKIYYFLNFFPQRARTCFALIADLSSRVYKSLIEGGHT